MKCCRISNTDITIVIFKKVQTAFENDLAGTFLPQGRGLATPGIDDRLMSMINEFLEKN